jgi:malate dehydrogenase (oxaloacetate-decarboxylating)
MDRAGAIYEGRKDHMNWAKEEISMETNPDKEQGSLEDVIKKADVFLGISAPGLLTKEMVRTMAKDAIVFAMANPTPEIFPDEAKEAGAAVIATGRSDFPNQINNCLGFPGIFRGALDVRASVINEEMKLAASRALASLVSDEELSPERIIPDALDERVVPAVAKGVADAAISTGVARKV